MVAKNGRLCKLLGPAPKMENDMAPLGDNQNKITYKQAFPEFPVLYGGKGQPPISLTSLLLAKGVKGMLGMMSKGMGKDATPNMLSGNGRKLAVLK